MKKPTTLQDIADYCNLSKGMVGKVIRNPEQCKASARTRQLVAEAVQKLDYRPNFAAKALTTRRTYCVGILFPAVNSFYYELGIKLDVALARHGYTSLFAYWDVSRNPLQAYQEVFERIRLRNVDAVVTCQHEPFLIGKGIPVIIYGNEYQDVDCVFPNKKDFGVRAVQYLVKKGHRDIGCSGHFPDIRYQAIREEMKRQDLEINEEWFIGGSSYSHGGYEAMQRILSCRHRPTAMIMHSDHMASGALLAAHEHGCRVPDDISILSYDNLNESQYTIPPLTTFDQDFPQGAELIAQVLLNRMDNPESPFRKYSFKMPLIERLSVKDLTS